MWLLNVKTWMLKQITNERDWAQKYAILSHTWTDDEVDFRDIKHNLKAATQKKGYAKIKYACRQADKDGLKYVWIDTCCIDKSSSAELSQAINSMYKWYTNAKVCYAYLSDVKVTGTRTSTDDDTRKLLEGSRWFTRSWTLQELIAPDQVMFFAHTWQPIGTKHEMVDLLSSITSIDADVLKDRQCLHSISVARRMSWAAHRQSSREEDQAYSLLGIFDVHMPMLYGEGEKAFIRLQEEIVRTSLDHSVFAWETWPDVLAGTLFSPSPYGFRDAAKIESWTVPERDESFELSNKGLRITLPALRRGSELRAVLNCRYSDQFMRPIALRLEVLPARSITPAKSSSTTVCYMKLAHFDKGKRSHLTTLDVNELHSTKWLDLVVAKEKPAVSGRQLSKKIMIHGSPSYNGFDLIDPQPPNAFNSKDLVMSLKVLESGGTETGRIIVADRQDNILTLAFAQTFEHDTAMLRYCLVSHAECDEPRRAAQVLLTSLASPAVAEAGITGGRKVYAKCQHMYVMGEEVWLITLAAASEAINAAEIRASRIRSIVDDRRHGAINSVPLNMISTDSQFYLGNFNTTARDNS